MSWPDAACAALFSRSFLVRRYLSQFSTMRPGIRRKWRRLSVTHTAPVAIACAAIKGSVRPDSTMQVSIRDFTA